MFQGIFELENGGGLFGKRLASAASEGAKAHLPQPVNSRVKRLKPSGILKVHKFFMPTLYRTIVTNSHCLQGSTQPHATFPASASQACPTQV